MFWDRPIAGFVALYGAPDQSDVVYDSIPRQHQLSNDVTHYNQVLNMHKIRSAEFKYKGDKPPAIDLGELRRKRCRQIFL